ncbi:MAG: hypothetical protein ACREIS_15030 [Nitrospiraceae bacterium]
MKLLKADWLFALAAGLIVLPISLLPSPHDRNPSVPDTQDHRQFGMEGTRATCHASGKGRLLAARHPKRQDCFRCHKPLEGV